MKQSFYFQWGLTSVLAALLSIWYLPRYAEVISQSGFQEVYLNSSSIYHAAGLGVLFPLIYFVLMLGLSFFVMGFARVALRYVARRFQKNTQGARI